MNYSWKNARAMHNAAQRSWRAVEMIAVPRGQARCGEPDYAHDEEEFAWIPKFLVRRPERTFVFTAVGDSMEPTIPEGAEVIVEEGAEYHHGSLVVVAMPSGKMIKRYDRTGKLVSDNPAYPPLELGINDTAEIIGVVLKIMITP